MSFVELTGPAKLDRRTKNLVKRLSADDIAIIDHTDLDRVSAEALLESGVRVVVNVAESQSGRFPNPGPLALVRGGIRLIDVDGADIFDDVHEGPAAAHTPSGSMHSDERHSVGVAHAAPPSSSGAQLPALQ